MESASKHERLVFVLSSFGLGRALGMANIGIVALLTKSWELGFWLKICLNNISLIIYFISEKNKKFERYFSQSDFRNDFVLWLDFADPYAKFYSLERTKSTKKSSRDVGRVSESSREQLDTNFASEEKNLQKYCTVGMLAVFARFCAKRCNFSKFCR